MYFNNFMILLIFKYVLIRKIIINNFVILTLEYKLYTNEKEIINHKVNQMQILNPQK